MKLTVDDQLSILADRCTQEVISGDDLRHKLLESSRCNRPLRVKLGLDPSAPDIHLGHTVVLRKLRQFQDMGHEVFLIIGDFTGMIGDPSGKSKTRKQLTRKEVAENAATYKNQVSKILDMDKTHLVFNSEWLAKLDLEQIIGITSKYTVARMMERDDFAKRFTEHQPIGVHEFLYPLMQAYDSVAIKADIELGGTDQMFNLLVGRDLQREFGQEPQVIIMCPLLEGIDGSQKMSKSLGNYVGIDEDPVETYGKIMSISDDLMIRYYSLVTGVSDIDIENMNKDIKSGKLHPMKAKEQLAKIIVTMYHDQEAAEKAALNFDRVFRQNKRPQDMDVIAIKKDGIDANGSYLIPELLYELDLVSSKSEGRRMVRQGAVRINGIRMVDENCEIRVKSGMIVQVGKRRFAEVNLL